MGGEGTEGWGGGGGGKGAGIVREGRRGVGDGRGTTYNSTFFTKIF